MEGLLPDSVCQPGRHRSTGHLNQLLPKLDQQIGPIFYPLHLVKMGFNFQKVGFFNVIEQIMKCPQILDCPGLLTYFL